MFWYVLFEQKVYLNDVSALNKLVIPDGVKSLKLSNIETLTHVNYGLKVINLFINSQFHHLSTANAELNNIFLEFSRLLWLDKIHIFIKPESILDNSYQQKFSKWVSLKVAQVKSCSSSWIWAIR